MRPAALTPPNLDRLYDYYLRRLMEANLKKQVKPLAEVEGLVKQLRDGWSEMLRSQTGGTGPKHARRRLKSNPPRAFRRPMESAHHTVDRLLGALEILTKKSGICSKRALSPKPSRSRTVAPPRR